MNVLSKSMFPSDLAASGLPAGQASQPEVSPEADRRRPASRLPTKVDVSVGGRIRELRRAARRTQKDLALSLGVTNVQLHRYEIGESRIPVGRLMAIATALDVGIEQLLSVPPGQPEPQGELRAEIDELVAVFSNLPERTHRSAILALARAMARVERS